MAICNGKSARAYRWGCVSEGYVSEVTNCLAVLAAGQYHWKAARRKAATAETAPADEQRKAPYSAEQEESCEIAAHYLKYCAEGGPAAQHLQNGYWDHSDGNLGRALLQYQWASELGYSIAMAGLAHLLTLPRYQVSSGILP
jgi:hypothetical protein